MRLAGSPTPAYDRLPYFFSDQYDVGMEYKGFARAWDRVVFRGDPATRELLDSGDFATLIADCAVTGATLNPTIFSKAITGSDRYDEQFRGAVASGKPGDRAPEPH